MSVRQALELIAAETGLKYQIEPERQPAVALSPPPTKPAPSPKPEASPPIVPDSPVRQPPPDPSKPDEPIPPVIEVTPRVTTLSPTPIETGVSEPEQSPASRDVQSDMQAAILARHKEKFGGLNGGALRRQGTGEDLLPKARTGSMAIPEAEDQGWVERTARGIGERGGDLVAGFSRMQGDLMWLVGRVPDRVLSHTGKAQPVGPRSKWM